MSSVSSNNVLTASRSVCLLRCPRQHYLSYEVGLRKDKAALPLRLGSAWARALDAIYQGQQYDGALAAALPADADLDEDAVALIAGLLAGYMRRWETFPIIKGRTFYPEKQFKSALPGAWSAEGKIDLLALDEERGDVVIIESKTTSARIQRQDDLFWTKIKHNFQLLQYVTAARDLGYEVSRVIYDVTRKPCIKPKMVPTLDAEGIKCVVDSKRERVFLKGRPRVTADKKKGLVLLVHKESRDEFSSRLLADTLRRPDFYFQRREVAIMENELRAFQTLRRELIALITHFRQRAIVAGIRAWPRNASDLTCRSCQYKDFCLTGPDDIDVTRLEGFTIGKTNPELEKYDDDATEPEEEPAEPDPEQSIQAD